ncbi:hypothetical protein HYN43_010800 [Mucilaginibacter celer]|uniref:Fibronectin type-III domain-containing protein n=2 Tax=Mucilaginibacter celer TaxID=2305508 RepID=A0A494VWR1_9SPHI|nr:hypothetical protein HYN43_010800 [Mucilaginibacter celer]
MFTKLLSTKMKKSCSILLAVFLFACGKGGDKLKPVSPPEPSKANLIFPSENALCTSGTVVSDKETTINFSWSAAANADSYEVLLKNLLTGVTAKQTAQSNQLALTVLRNTPYSWSVISKSQKSTATAETLSWKFYVAGVGIINYSPFPAALVAPIFGKHLGSTTSFVDLQWIGNDVDNDIDGYDVYFGITSKPALLKSNNLAMNLSSVPVSKGTTYYWKVITKDKTGNASESGLFQFTVDQ